MKSFKEFLAILICVFLIFTCIFSFLAACLFMIAGPTIMHTIIGTPIALTVLSASIFGIKKTTDWGMK